MQATSNMGAVRSTVNDSDVEEYIENISFKTPGNIIYEDLIIYWFVES